MASTSAVSMALPLPSATQRKFLNPASLPLTLSKVVSPSKVTSGNKLVVKASASVVEKVVSGLTAGILTASMMVPQVAEAAGSGVSPSLNNFLLSIAAGGVVLAAILGAIVGVSNFDPVKRA